MGSESIAHQAEGRMGYWLRSHEGERKNCFSKIQLANLKQDFNPFLPPKIQSFFLLVGFNL